MPITASPRLNDDGQSEPGTIFKSLWKLTCHRSCRLQDQIVSQVLAESHKEECRFCHAADDDSPSAVNDSNDEPRPCGSSRPDRQPVALFTSGGMGAGKGHVLRTFLEDGRIRLEDNFVWCGRADDSTSRLLLD